MSLSLMGYFTITPRVNTILACRLNQWLHTRRGFHPEPTSMTPEQVSDTTLAGETGENYKFCMPSFQKAAQALTDDGYDPAFVPHLIGRNSATSCGLSLVNDRLHDRSFLIWDGSPVYDDIEIYLREVIDLLTRRNHETHGTFAAIENNADTLWSLKIVNRRFMLERLSQLCECYYAHETDGKVFKEKDRSLNMAAQGYMANPANQYGLETWLGKFIRKLSDLRISDPEKLSEIFAMQNFAKAMLDEFCFNRTTPNQLLKVISNPGPTMDNQKIMEAVQASEEAALRPHDPNIAMAYMARNPALI